MRIIISFFNLKVHSVDTITSTELCLCDNLGLCFSNKTKKMCYMPGGYKKNVETLIRIIGKLYPLVKTTLGDPNKSKIFRNTQYSWKIN